MPVHRSTRPRPAHRSDTVTALIRTAAAANPAAIAIVDSQGGHPLAYGEFVDQIDRATAWLRGNGLCPGDRVALWASNGAPWAVFAFAVMQLGGSVTTLNPAAVERELDDHLRRTGARLIAAAPDLVPAAAATGVRVVSLGASHGVPTLTEVLAASAPDPTSEPQSADEVALIPFSSGTTGLPKGVMLSHRNLVTVVDQLGHALDVDGHDTTLAVAPWFHILGFTAGLLLPLASGATVVTQPRFDPDRLIGLLAEHEVTYVAVPPPIATILARHPDVDRGALASLRLIAVGGAPLAPSTHRTLAARLPHCAIGQGWGLTETAGALAVPTQEGSRPGTIGPLVAGTELRVVDPATGTDVDDGIDGELLARGPQTMIGYLDDRAATAALIDPDGWVHTGDLGHVETDGGIVIVDRIKDLIKVNALQVAPAELEAVLTGHPAVVDAAVVGRPDALRGERPVAFVVLGEETDAESIRAWHDERVAPYKRLAEIHTVDSLPRTPSGKLLRRHLREQVDFRSGSRRRRVRRRGSGAGRSSPTGSRRSPSEPR